MRRPTFYDNSVSPVADPSVQEIPYGPDATATFSQRLNDASKWARIEGVPIFKPHQREDPNTKKLISVDLPKLHRIAQNMQRMERQGGVPIRMTLGHTEPGKPETHQPPLAGFYRNARVQRFGPSGEPAIVVDEWLDPQFLPVRRNYPYRSSEYYDDTEQITGVALLSRDPFLDLGVVAYSEGRTPTLYNKPWLPDAGSLSYTSDLPNRRNQINYARSSGQPIPTMYRLTLGDVRPMNPNQQWTGPAVPPQPVPQYPEYMQGQSVPAGYGEYPPSQTVQYPQQYMAPPSVPYGMPGMDGGVMGMMNNDQQPNARYGRSTAYWDGNQPRGGNPPEAVPHRHTNTGAVYANPGSMTPPRPMGRGETIGRGVGGVGGGMVGGAAGGYFGGPPGAIAGRAVGSRVGTQLGGHVGRMLDDRQNRGGPAPPMANSRYARSGRRGRGSPGYYAEDDEEDYDGPPDQGGGMEGGPEPMPPEMGGGMPSGPSAPPSTGGNPMEELFNLSSQMTQVLQQMLGGGAGGPACAPMPPNTPFPGGGGPPMNASRYGRRPAPRGRSNYGNPQAPTQYVGNGNPQQYPRTISGLPVGYQLKIDKLEAENRQLQQQMTVVMYERNEADTQACYAEIGKLAQAGYDVGEYEVSELKRRNPEERAFYLQQIATKYSRIGTEPLPPHLGDPSPHHMAPQAPGPLTKQQMDQALQMVGNAPDPGGVRYAQAVEAIRYGHVPQQQGPFGANSVFNNPEALEQPFAPGQVNRLQQPSMNGQYGG